MKEQVIFDMGVFDPDDYLYFYGDWLTDSNTLKQVDFFCNVLNMEKGMKILDLACGHGRHANKFAARGYDVTGVDVVQGFLDIAQKQAQQRKVHVNYQCQDMRKIDFQEEFARILLIFTAFGYFNDEENLQVLKNVARALKPDGLFCFDTWNRDIFLKVCSPYDCVEKNGVLMIDRHSFDPLSGRLLNRRVIIRDGKRKDIPFSIRFYNATEICQLLEKAGLEAIDIYDGWNERLLHSEAKRMVIVARKKEE